MAPIIPTYRPFVTPLRAAITTAVLAMACSTVTVFDAAQAGLQASAAVQDCHGGSAGADAVRGAEGVASGRLHSPSPSRAPQLANASAEVRPAAVVTGG